MRGREAKPSFIYITTKPAITSFYDIYSKKAPKRRNGDWELD